MSLRRPTALIALAAAALALAGCGGGSSSSKPDVPSDAIGVVGTRTLLKKDFEHLMAVGLASMKVQGQTAPKPGTAEYVSLQSNAVYRMFVIAVIRQEAAAEGIKVDPKKETENLAKVTSNATYAKQLKDAGYTQADVKDLIEINLLGAELQKKATKTVSAPTAAAIQAYYDANKETQYKDPEARSVQHILLGLKNGGSPKASEFPALLVQANAVLKQLKGGADFTKLVKQYSTDPGKVTNDGKYPKVTARDYQPEFAAASMKLKTGEYTLVPVKTVFGYHIIKALAGIVPAGYQAFDTVKASIQQQLQSKASSEATSTWFRKLIISYVAKSSFATGYALPASATAPVTTAGVSSTKK